MSGLAQKYIICSIILLEAETRACRIIFFVRGFACFVFLYSHKKEGYRTWIQYDSHWDTIIIMEALGYIFSCNIVKRFRCMNEEGVAVVKALFDGQKSIGFIVFLNRQQIFRFKATIFSKLLFARFYSAFNLFDIFGWGEIFRFNTTFAQHVSNS